MNAPHSIFAADDDVAIDEASGEVPIRREVKLLVNPVPANDGQHQAQNDAADSPA